MDLFNNQYNIKLDYRIHLKTFLNKKGETEVYPLNSFPFEICMMWESTAPALITCKTMTPNTTLLNICSNDIVNITSMLALSKCGISSGFYFYEQTILKNKKYVYLYLSLNAVNNTRCALVSDLNQKMINTISDNQPAAKWSEREMQDMFNIKIRKLPDSRRLLLDYKTPKGVMAFSQKSFVQPAYSPFYDLYYV